MLVMYNYNIVIFLDLLFSFSNYARCFVLMWTEFHHKVLFTMSSRAAEQLPALLITLRAAHQFRASWLCASLRPVACAAEG